MNSLNNPAEILGDIKMLFDTSRATVMTATPHVAINIHTHTHTNIYTYTYMCVYLHNFN